MKTESGIAVSFVYHHKIESRINFEKAFYYFGITFYFTGFVSFLSLSLSYSLSNFRLCSFIPAQHLH